MSKHISMSLEEHRALLAALYKRYPDEGDPSISLSGKNPWRGTAKYHHTYGTNTAIFTFNMQGRNGEPSLYIERDWED